MRKCFLVLVVFIAISCKRTEAEPVGLGFYFEIPQPSNDSELDKIPNKFQGLFMNSDSVFVNVKENLIIKKYYNRFRIHNKELDSIKESFDIVGNNYISKLNKEIFEVKYLKDSIEFSNKQIDTFFIFSDLQKATRFDGKLILNYKDSIFWRIKSISIEKNKLKIQYIYSENDLKRIDSLTKVKSKMIDSLSFIIKPSRNEFKRILNLKNLGESTEYIKVKK
ncbi:hypothetical protein FFWV33_17260 [Flavobacterium faecale]|uniref:Lipoprotein n=1 Tax=Flavobacterium faecale TaxID=1355330 RepID=A0A2S1LH80_9FLAO|nr:hypothetical protein [Flavobacterium faecale]AWG23152.1 hypothetical protein FFWV33_17260 [Flavobacterium faecale]